jgi:hypothetical protein
MRYSEQANPSSPPDPSESPVRSVEMAHLPLLLSLRVMGDFVFDP